MEEVATVGQGRKGLDGRHSVRGRPVWQWMDKKIELRRPGRTKWEDLAQSWVIQRRQWCLCGKQDGQETAPYCSPLFTDDRPALHQPQSCPGFPVWPGPLSQHKRLKLLVPFSKPKCCRRGWRRRMLMKMKAGIQADVTSDSWQCGGNSGSVWIKRPYRACGPRPLGDSELHRQFWKCTAVGWYILYQCLNAAAVGGSLGDTARRCKGPCWVGGAGFPPSASTWGGGMVVRAVSHTHPGCTQRA